MAVQVSPTIDRWYSVTACHVLSLYRNPYPRRLVQCNCRPCTVAVQESPTIEGWYNVTVGHVLSLYRNPYPRRLVQYNSATYCHCTGIPTLEGWYNVTVCHVLSLYGNPYPRRLVHCNCLPRTVTVPVLKLIAPVAHQRNTAVW